MPPKPCTKKKQINNRTWSKKDGQEQKRGSGENVTLPGPQCWNGLSEMSHLTQTSHLTHLTHMTHVTSTLAGQNHYCCDSL